MDKTLRNETMIVRAAALQTGVTLLEVLVVLAIASLASAIVFQGFSQITIIDRQFGAQNDFMRDQAMTRSWWRTSIESLQPDAIDGNSKFKGTSKEFLGLSTSTLGNRYGSTQPIHWTLEFSPQSGTVNLISHSNKRAETIQSWQGSSGDFFYHDADGKRHTTWPPETGTAPQIPALIEMRITSDGRHDTLVATPMGPKYPPLKIQNTLPGVS